ncbi:MAG: class II aldolase/adducin family protein [Bacillota bacterium]
MKRAPESRRGWEADALRPVPSTPEAFRGARNGDNSRLPEGISYREINWGGTAGIYGSSLGTGRSSFLEGLIVGRDEILEELIRIGRESYRLRLTPGTAGNLSVRSEKGLIISRSGVSLGFAVKDDYLEVTGDDAGGNGRPSSELPMHAAIYRKVPEARAVLHFHGPWIIQIGTREHPRRWIPEPMPPEFSRLAPEGYVPRVPAMDPGSARLANATGEAFLCGSRGAVLCGHGGVAWGDDPRDALHCAEAMESAAGGHFLYRLARMVEGRDAR